MLAQAGQPLLAFISLERKPPFFSTTCNSLRELTLLESLTLWLSTLSTTTYTGRVIPTVGTPKEALNRLSRPP